MTEPIERLIKSARDDSSVGPAGWETFMKRAHRALFWRRAAAAGGAVALIAVGVAGAAVLRDPGPAPIPPAESPTVTPEPSEEPSPTQTEEPTPTESRSVEEEKADPLPPFEAEQWFTDQERLQVTTSQVTPDQTVPPTPEAIPGLKLEAAIAGLLAAPGDASAIPEGTKLLGTDLLDTIATIDLSEEFESGGGSLGMQLRLGQLVYTATQFQDVRRVKLSIEGEPVEAFGGEGIVIPAEGLTRRDFQNVAPPIVVESPKFGEGVPKTFTVSGFANVYEATVNIRLRHVDGDIVEETFTTATCGTGCWGDFEKKIRLPAGDPAHWYVEVFVYSGEDGSPRDLVKIPILEQT